MHGLVIVDDNHVSSLQDMAMQVGQECLPQVGQRALPLRIQGGHGMEIDAKLWIRGRSLEHSHRGGKDLVITDE
jgi:hypothetical protein